MPLSSVSDGLDWFISVEACKVRQEVLLLRRRFPDATAFELAQQAFSDVRLSVIKAGAAMGLAANPLLSVASALADLSITTRAQLFAAACAAELLIPGFLNSETARYELLVPVLGPTVISQLAVELGLKAARTATRDAVMTRVFGRRVTQRALMTKTIPLVGCLIGGAWNALEVEVIRNRTLHYLTNQVMDPVEVVDVEVVSS